MRRMVNAENGPLEDWVISSEGFADTAGYGGLIRCFTYIPLLDRYIMS